MNSRIARPAWTFPYRARCVARYIGAGTGLSLIAACTGVQSAFDSFGEDARTIAKIGWILFAGGGVIFAAVIALAAGALFGRDRLRATLADSRAIVAGGVVFPLVVLAALLIYTLFAAAHMVRDRAVPAVQIEVIAEQWWWRVRYLDAAGRHDFTTANEIHIPTGQPVEFILKSSDVIHSFWVPNLAGKLDMIPGRVNRLRVTADRAGTMRGQCAEFCGGPHALMAFHVVSMPPADFAAWQARERAPAQPPNSLESERGRTLFLAHCTVCHTVRGLAATGQLGPDLTHVGSRRSIAAGVLPTNVGTLAGWIAASQRIKPANLMPSFDAFQGDELRALAAYLANLK